MPRSATTFLYHTLSKHPSIFVPSRKETDYFTFNYYRGIDWYLNYYNDMSPDHIGFDISPIYFMDKKAPKRILKFSPNTRLILIIRNPIDWSLSFYNNIQALSYKKLHFSDFLNGYTYKKDGQSLKLEFKNSSVKKKIVDYCNTFGDNLLLCDFSIIHENPLSMLKAVETFVGVPTFFSDHNFQNVIINASEKQSLTFVNILMKNKLFVDLVTKLFPKKLIMLVRYKFQVSAPKNTKFQTKNKPADKNVKLAQEVFTEDIKFISQLFKNSKILLGKGMPFAFSQQKLTKTNN